MHHHCEDCSRDRRDIGCQYYVQQMKSRLHERYSAKIQGETYCSLGVTTFSVKMQGFIKSLEISATMSLFLLR